MLKTNKDQTLDQILADVLSCTDMCVAVDEHLNYLALNEAACSYLKMKQEDLVGKNAIQVFPEIIASKNHRNILRALSGKVIRDELVESRMGDILKTTYEPMVVDKEVKGVVLHAVMQIGEVPIK